MALALDIANASYCERANIGALLEKDGNIIAFGYNGMPAGMDNCCEIDGVTRPEVLHAESNAIAKCARSGISSEGSTLYVTTSPCIECAKLIIQAGITRVVYRDNYRLSDGLQLLAKTNIHIHRLV